MKISHLFFVLVLVTAVMIFVTCKEKITEPGEEIITVIPAPTLISPAYGSLLSTSTVQLEWYSVADADSYEVVVDNSNDFSSPEFNSSDVQDTTVTTDALNAGVYYWKVKTENSNWSNVWIFTISANKPSAPELHTPAYGSAIYDSTFSFNWENLGAGYTYELQVDTSSSFSNPIIYKKNLTKSNIKISEENISELKPDMYFWRARSRDRAGNFKAWSNPWWFFFWLMFDINGNIYKTVKICNQVWMAENLACTHYRDGFPIFNGIYNEQWEVLSDNETGGYCSYTNNDNLIDPYGRLYNWFAVVDPHNIAPEGWHVPTDEEWKTLEICLGMSQSEVDDDEWRGTDEGGKLKEVGTIHWLPPNEGATNESGFTALASGYRDHFIYQNAYFTDLGYRAYFWTTTEGSDYRAWMRCVAYKNTGIYRKDWYKILGFSVRLIKD